MHRALEPLIAVEPFNDSMDLDRWGDWHAKWSATAGIARVPAALTTASAEDGERQ